MTWTELGLLLGVVASLAAQGVAWYNSRTAAKSGDASTAKDVGDAYRNLIAPLEKRITELSDRLAVAEKRADALLEQTAALSKELEKANEREKEYLAGIRVLITQITSLGERPLWKPKDDIG